MARKIQPVTEGGTGATDASTARSNLGLGSIATQSASNVAITGGSITGTSIGSLSAAVPIADGGTGATTASGARTNLGLGTIATQAANSVAITGGSISGLSSAIAIADGGTGATTASGARSALSTYSQTEIDAKIVMESVGGKIQPKAAYASEPLRIGTVEATLATAYAAFTNKGANIVDSGTYLTNAFTINASEFNSGNKNTDNSTPYTLTASATRATFQPYYAFDSNETTTWWASAVPPVTYPSWLKVDMGTQKKIVAYKILAHPTVGSNGPTTFKLQGNNTASDVTGWVDVDSRSISPYSPSATAKFTCASPSMYRYYRLYITAADGDNDLINSLYLYEGTPATTSNTFDTPNLASGQTFVPSTFKIFDETYNGDGTTGLITDAAAYNMTFRRINGSGTTDFSGSLITGTAFRALPATDFASCTELKLRIQPVGYQKIGGVSINSSAAALVAYPDGYLVATINGVDVWKTTAAGDESAAKQTCTDLTASGTVSLNTKVTNRYYLQTADNNWQTIATFAVAVDEAVKLEADLVAIKSDGAAVAAYGKKALVTRVGSNAPVAVGIVGDTDIESTTTGNYTDASSWDVTVDVSSNNAIVKVRGGTGMTVNWQAHISRHSITKTTAA